MGDPAAGAGNWRSADAWPLQKEGALMGWFFPVLFAVIVLGGLLASKRLSRTAIEITVVAILIGLAGYAWQGSPTLAGSPVTRSTPAS
jgi:hypothetical protein